MSEIRFHDSVADKFRDAATDITKAEHLTLGSIRQPVIEGVQVVGYIQEELGNRRLIVWYESQYRFAYYNKDFGWHSTSVEMDEVFVPFYPTKPHRTTSYEWE